MNKHEHHVARQKFTGFDVRKDSSIVGEPLAGPNSKCPCNSGRKFKKCCGALGMTTLQADAMSAGDEQCTE